MSTNAENLVKEHERKNGNVDGRRRDALIAYTAFLSQRLYSARSMAFGGERDFYTVLGYKTTPIFEDFHKMYMRDDIATRIVEIFPDATWGKDPLIFDGEPPMRFFEFFAMSGDIKREKTEFEKAWEKLVYKFQVFSVLHEFNVQATIGRYGVILYGIPGPPRAPIRSTDLDSIMYMRVFNEGDAAITKWENVITNERFGLPDIYQVRNTETEEIPGFSYDVHYSRILHYALRSPNKVIGVPILAGVYNRIIDLTKVAGGGSEAFWKGAHKGYNIDIDPEYTLDPDDEEKMLQQIDEFDHGLRRFMLTRGGTLTDMGADIVDPSGLYGILMDLIAAYLDIPKRILVGTESGDLASSQDEENWSRTIARWQKRQVEPYILRPFIDRMIELGVLPQPIEDKYQIWWPSTMTMNPLQLAEIVGKIGAAIASVAQSRNVMTPQEFRSMFLGLLPEPEQGMGELWETQSPPGQEGQALPGGVNEASFAPEPVLEQTLMDYFMAKLADDER